MGHRKLSERLIGGAFAGFSTCWHGNWLNEIRVLPKKMVSRMGGGAVLGTGGGVTLGGHILHLLNGLLGGEHVNCWETLYC